MCEPNAEQSARFAHRQPIMITAPRHASNSQRRCAHPLAGRSTWKYSHQFQLPLQSLLTAKPTCWPIYVVFVFQVPQQPAPLRPPARRPQHLAQPSPQTSSQYILGAEPMYWPFQVKIRFKTLPRHFQQQPALLHPSLSVVGASGKHNKSMCRNGKTISSFADRVSSLCGYFAQALQHSGSIGPSTRRHNRR